MSDSLWTGGVDQLRHFDRAAAGKTPGMLAKVLARQICNADVVVLVSRPVCVLLVIVDQTIPCAGPPGAQVLPWRPRQREWTQLMSVGSDLSRWLLVCGPGMNAPEVSITR